MHLLLTGAPASGKTRVALERFQTSRGSLLLVPTATMAEHVRHTLARTGALVRPSSIQTLAKFVDEWAPLGAAPLPLLHLLIERALERTRPRRFREVAQFPGFVAALAELFSGAPPAAMPEDLGRVLGEVQHELGARGMALREDRLRPAAARAPARETILDGFFTLSEGEAAFAAELAQRSAVTVTLPAWPGAAQAREALLRAGFVEQRLEGSRRAGRRAGFAAPTIEREAEEIAARILDEAARGRPFREMGIVLRVREPYGSLLETTLARFGIPARFYFTDPVARHPAVMFLSGIARAWLKDWDPAEWVPALRMPVSGIGATPAGDALDFEWRERLPEVGQEELLRAIGNRPGAGGLSTSLTSLKKLIGLAPAPDVIDGASRERAHAWQSTAAALRAFGDAIDAAAAALGDTPCAWDVFWRQVDRTLSLEQLRIPDQRRNVVHVMDAYEARQWELPVVFVCGLTERHFPQYHRIDPLLPDAAALAAKQLEERFLFAIATSRATEETVLSYPRYDEQGQETLPSFFLEGATFTAVEGPGYCPPARVPPPLPAIHETLPAPHTLSPSAIESFLQCPFQFFAHHTLRLRERPAAPRDRLDLLLQGSILHRALAELAQAPLLGPAVLDRVFEEECEKHRIPATYRREAVRLELLRHFTAFLEDQQVNLSGWRARFEEKFTFALNPALAIRGRIDRLEVAPDGRALVIDYKYSAGDKIRDRVEQTETGDQVQGGLYLLAAERVFGLRPAGMLYCGLKKGVTWGGWHASIEGLHEIGERRGDEGLRELMGAAERAAADAHEAIAAGRIAPQPADRNKCRWCDYRDICRVEVAAGARGAGGA